MGFYWTEQVRLRAHLARASMRWKLAFRLVVPRRFGRLGEVEEIGGRMRQVRMAKRGVQNS